MKWRRIEDIGVGCSCNVCQEETDELFEPYDFDDDAEENLFCYAFHLEPCEVAACQLCIDHGIFNQLFRISLSLNKPEPILDWLKEQGVPFRVKKLAIPRGDGPQRVVHFYPRQEREFLERLASFLQ